MRRHIQSTVSVILLLVGVILFSTLVARAASLTARVQSAEAAAGEQVDIPVMVAGSPGMVAMHLELVYDPAVLAVETVDQGQLLAGNALLEFNTEEPGLMVIGFASTDPVMGEGELAVIHFNVTGTEGQTSPLNLQNCRAWEEQGIDILVNTESGEFLVKEAGISPDVWLFLAIMCVLVLIGGFFVLGLFWFIRRQR